MANPNRCDLQKIVRHIIDERGGVTFSHKANIYTSQARHYNEVVYQTLLSLIGLIFIQTAQTVAQPPSDEPQYGDPFAPGPSELFELKVDSVSGYFASSSTVTIVANYHVKIGPNIAANGSYSVRLRSYIPGTSGSILTSTTNSGSGAILTQNDGTFSIEPPSSDSPLSTVTSVTQSWSSTLDAISVSPNGSFLGDAEAEGVSTDGQVRFDYKSDYVGDPI